MSATILKKFQKQVQAYVMQGDESAAKYVRKPNNMSAVDRLRVYRNGYYLRLMDIIEGDFKVLHKIMGDEAFFSMGKDYFNSHPSQSFNIRNAGINLVRFLSRNNEVNPAVIELAQFEWAMHEALISEDALALTLENLATMNAKDWPTVTFHWHPSVRQIICNYNIFALWQYAVDENQVIPFRQLDAPAIHLVWRHNHEIYYCCVENNALKLVELINQGESFADICELMCEVMPEDKVVSWVSETLREWIQDEMFLNCKAITC